MRSYGVVDDRHRGRIIGASGTLYAVCQFLGPLLLGQTGVTGSVPIIAAIVPLAVGVVVALMVPSAIGEAEEDDLGNLSGLKLAVKLALGGARVHVADVGLLLRDDVGDARQQPRPVLAVHQQRRLEQPVVSPLP